MEPAKPTADGVRQTQTPFADILSKLSVSQLLAAFIGLAYVCGYLIHSCVARDLGIHTDSFLKAEYLEIGIVFILLSLSIFIFPIGMYFLIRLIYDEANEKDETSKEEAKSQQEVYRKTPQVTLLIVVNLLYVILFFALFVTNDEWKMQMSLFGMPLSRMYGLLSWFICIVIGLLVLM